MEEEAKSLKSMGTALGGGGGNSRAQMGEAPVVFSAEQALGGKRSAIEAIQLAEDRVEALQSPADSQQVRV
jgi:hypothetical protein